MACSWRGSKERLWLLPQGVESWFGGWVHEGLADLDEAVLAPIGAGEGWIDGMGCSSVYCWIEWRPKERRAWRLRSAFGGDPRCRTDLFR
ncbi:hypothetical protein M0R45_030902 [Rubus argutus]|uniref:Uncharacterized protein n=1 Tax=Rubus argutus TaxID=59490 RepID=A0AAW1WFP4_RUBAR